jgi:hypothetical protein
MGWGGWDGLETEDVVQKRCNEFLGLSDRDRSVLRCLEGVGVACDRWFGTGWYRMKRVGLAV